MVHVSRRLQAVPCIQVAETACAKSQRKWAHTLELPTAPLVCGTRLTLEAILRRTSGSDHKRYFVLRRQENLDKIQHKILHHI